MNAAIQRNVTADNFSEVQNMIRKVVGRFTARFGGDYQELLCEANYFFMKAQNTYDPEQASFTTWVYNVVWLELTNLDKKSNKNHARYGAPLPEEILAPTKRSLEELVEGLSTDAKAIVTTALGDPAIPSHIGSARAYLRNAFLNAGWTIQQFRAAFNEIQGAL